MKTILALAVLAVVVTAASVQADVTNGSFEDAPSGTYTTSGSYDYVSAGSAPYPYTAGKNTTLITGWTATAIPQGGYYGLVDKNVFSPSEDTAGDTQGAFIVDYYGGSVGTLVSDSTGTIAANTTYTLSLNIGAPPSFSLTSDTVGETAPTVYFALLGNGNVITSSTLINTSVTQNGLTNYTLSFTTGASGGFVGDDLTVELQATKANYPGGYSKTDPGGEEAIFDNVALSVPEPSAWALIAAGCALVPFLRVRRISRS